MDDSSSVTAAERCSLKKNQEAEVAMGIPERPRLRSLYKESMGLNRALLRKRLLLFNQFNKDGVRSSCAGIILYIIAVQLVGKFELVRKKSLSFTYANFKYLIIVPTVPFFNAGRRNLRTKTLVVLLSFLAEIFK
ncbi:hypothetical protein Zmor_006334 [Zophobas morio]|uniref:Uncharacterized protein n=1 Tax=Zophobas morio TaxID=2755281 RepID=A0AA38IX96_9CUCU|nr:hypothetical protein Zmor_006334 [Zophobas morio]